MLEYQAYCLSSIVYKAIVKNDAPILTVPDFFDSLKRRIPKSESSVVNLRYAFPVWKACRIRL